MGAILPVRVLVIDDDESVCRRLARWLQEQAFDVQTALTAVGAMQAAAGDPFHLALVDLRMPDIETAELLGGLRQAAPRMGLIALAAFPEPEQIAAARSAGATEILEKPVQQAALLAAVGGALESRGIVGRSEEEFYRRLGARLRELRRAAGRTLQDVAVPSGISVSQLSQIERGRHGTSVWTLVRLCHVLETSPERLFGRL